MKSRIKTVNSSKGLRELTGKELNEIPRAVGNWVRAQTIELKVRMKESLKKEIAATCAAYTANKREISNG